MTRNEVSTIRQADETLLPSSRWRIYAYLGCLMTLTSLSDPNGALLDVPFSLVLKNSLGLQAHELSTYRLIAGIPLYASLLFGLARDNWSPFRLGDRGYVLTFSLASAAIFAAFTVVPVSVRTLLLASLTLTTLSLFIASAQIGLAAAIGRQHAMTGRISAAWNVFTALPSTLLFFGSGLLSEYLSGTTSETAVRVLLSTGAALSLIVAGFALWRANDVYDNVRREHSIVPRFRQDILTLVHHRPVYPALLIWLLWNFSPGSITPLQYHLQDALGASAWQWGSWNAIFAASFVPTYFLYGVLCQRIPLRRLLWLATAVAIPQFVPLIFVGSVSLAMTMAVPAGLMGGLATAAYVDLLMRSAPRGLQGTMLMAASSMYFISTRFGDLLGSYVYDHTSGFGVCVLLTTLCYVFIFPVLRWIAPELVATTDR